MQLRNHMEIVVQYVLADLLKDQPSVCQCEKCQADMMAIALNHLPPKYYVTDEGAAYSKANELSIQFEADVMRELVLAMVVIKEHPRHEA
ncbi:late competence development ComFB family protein [Anoxynatronum buryatiense]|uniref:Competence protein ComFB n=1 Tax=Anoxynatronum buryatiense TaxID=489973 RepID=A0AA45WUM5_9CLOT|nr:late competence development ComFB family protein [Anoxynatronum buryatiense]SMP48664.1 competence protein ComFB [Anoxynatronum buryatiense]